MEQMLQWGLEFIRLVQTCANPPFTVVMRIITSLGSATAYLIVLPFVYWCVDERKGSLLAAAVLISVWINIALKLMLDQPRPFFEGYDPSLGMISERMGGLPSGHAQNSLVMLVIIASWLKRKWAYICAALLCLLIGFSRIYLGVHFPTDVLGGWILGGLVLCGYFLLSGRIEALLVKGGFRAGMITSAILSFLMILYLPGEELLMPAGVTLGMGTGYSLNLRYVGFRSSAFCGKTGVAKYLNLLIRFLLGITGLLVIYILAGKIIPHGSGNRALFGFVRFALAGFWGYAGAPWIYIRLHLADNLPDILPDKQKEQ